LPETNFYKTIIRDVLGKAALERAMRVPAMPSMPMFFEETREAEAPKPQVPKFKPHHAKEKP